MINDQRERIRSIKLSKVKLPPPRSISDAKVMQGKQAPLKDVDILFATLSTSGAQMG